MRRLVSMSVAAIVLAASVAVFAGQQDFTLINRTGLTINELYVSPTNVNDWEEDVLGVDVLPNGEKVDITFSRDENECIWDLKVVDEDGDSIVWTKINLCKASEITLFYEKGQPTAQIK